MTDKIEYKKAQAKVRKKVTEEKISIGNKHVKEFRVILKEGDAQRPGEL